MPLYPPAVSVETSSGFQRALTPTWLALTCLLGGHRPPDLARPFRYAHLGCGTGVTTAIVAAVHPDASVWAWSPRPAEIEATRRLRDAGRLDNLAVHERSRVPFDLGGEPVDLVVVEGVLDCVSDADRAAVIAAVDRDLRPGGLVCVTYKTTVGWIEIAPLQRVLRHVAAHFTGDPELLGAELLDLLDQLRRGGARHLTDRPVVAEWVGELMASDPATLVADHLSEALRPLSHPQVAEALGPVGCHYLGGARLTDDLGFNVPTALAAEVAAAGTSILREACRDLAARPATRLDVFRRGAAPLGPAEQAERLREVSLVGLADPIPGESPELRPDGWARLRDAAVTVAELVVEDDDGSLGPTLRLLLERSEAHPMVAGGLGEDAVAGCRPLNVALAELGPLRAAPLLGSGVPIGVGPADDLLIRLGIR